MDKDIDNLPALQQFVVSPLPGSFKRHKIIITATKNVNYILPDGRSGNQPPGAFNMTNMHSVLQRRNAVTTLLLAISCVAGFCARAQVICREPRGCFKEETYTYSKISDPDPSKLVTINITSFGANGTDKLSDHKAFVNAAKFISARGGNVVLNIPPGIYYVGKQYKGGCDYLLSQTEVFPLVNCSNVTINGTTTRSGKGKVIIKHSSGLYYGGFNKNLSKSNQWLNVPLAGIGNVFSFRQCKDVTVQAIEFDGNSGAYRLGGNAGGENNRVGIQLPDVGIYVYRSYRLNFDKLTVHHFGLDGIYLANATTATNPAEAHWTTITNTVVEDCGRNCVTLAGADDLVFQNCRFSQSANRKIQSPPNACVDIEAEMSKIENGKEKSCGVENTNQQFIGCTFKSVLGYAVNNATTAASNISFKNCEVIQLATQPAREAITVFINGASSNWRFDSCRLYGSGVSHGDGVAFTNTLFQNCYKGDSTNGRNYLMEITSPTTTIDACTFNTFSDKRAIHIAAGKCGDGAPVISNTTFNSYKYWNKKGIDQCAIWAGRAIIIYNSTLNYFKTLIPTYLNVCPTDRGRPLEIKPFPAGFVAPTCDK